MGETVNKYSSEMCERAVRLVLENAGQHESLWSATLSISSKICCAPQRRTNGANRAYLMRRLRGYHDRDDEGLGAEEPCPSS